MNEQLKNLAIKLAKDPKELETYKSDIKGYLEKEGVDNDTIERMFKKDQSLFGEARPGARGARDIQDILLPSG